MKEQKTQKEFERHNKHKNQHAREPETEECNHRQKHAPSEGRGRREETIQEQTKRRGNEMKDEETLLHLCQIPEQTLFSSIMEVDSFGAKMGLHRQKSS